MHSGVAGVPQLELEEELKKELELAANLAKAMEVAANLAKVMAIGMALILVARRASGGNPTSLALTAVEGAIFGTPTIDAATSAAEIRQRDKDARRPQGWQGWRKPA
jgi:hypothetical protein